MKERLTLSLWRLRESIRARCTRRRRVERFAPIRGNMRSVIVVKPENAMFSEAVFILSDEYLRSSSASPQEILRQAREAAGEYSGSLNAFSHKKATGLLWLLPLALAAGIFGAKYLGIF